MKLLMLFVQEHDQPCWPNDNGTPVGRASRIGPSWPLTIGAKAHMALGLWRLTTTDMMVGFGLGWMKWNKYIYSFLDAELLKWELVLYGTDVYIGPTGYEPSSILAERSVQPHAHGALFDSSSSNNERGGGMPWLILAILFFSIFPPLILDAFILPI